MGKTPENLPKGEEVGKTKFPKSNPLKKGKKKEIPKRRDFPQKVNPGPEPGNGKIKPRKFLMVT